MSINTCKTFLICFYYDYSERVFPFPSVDGKGENIFSCLLNERKKGIDVMTETTTSGSMGWT